MLNHDNRVVEFPNRYQLVPVPGTTDVFDFVPVPGTITNAGGKSNYALFESIKDDINARLATSAKATQAEAEAGSNNTKYMTPLRTKNFCNKNVGLKKTKLPLSTSANTTILLENYIAENINKLEILLNARMTSSYSPIKLTASRIVPNDSGDGTGWSTTRNICEISTVYQVNGKLVLYPSSLEEGVGTYFFDGYIRGSSSGSIEHRTECGTFENITSIEIGKIIDNSRYSNQVTILQHLR